MVSFVDESVYRRVVEEAVDEVDACICKENEKWVLQERPEGPGDIRRGTKVRRAVGAVDGVRGEIV